MRLTDRQWGWATVALALWVIGPGVIEGKLSPVVTPMRGATGVSQVVRPNCRLERVVFYSGSRQGRRPHARQSVTAKPAEQELIVLNPPSRRSFGNAYHRCFIFGVPLPWETRSRLWR